MNVVVVESPAKAKTINKYLGADYRVVASLGHVRDLPAKDGSVRPEEDFAITYEIDAKSKKQINEIAQALKGAKRLYLATDPDREGEAISWHVLESLKELKKLKPDLEIKRVVFNEITKRAVLEAMKSPRDVDMDLVNAQQARRALDYLVGFTLSPVLWRKLPSAKSAGRVQSVALRLVCEREMEIEAFKPQEYWTIDADFLTPRGDQLTARLALLDGAKVEKFTIGDAAAAERARALIEAQRYRVGKVETKPARRHPAPPFMTSTLQQEASRKLGFSARRTMQVAQRLYEGVEIDGDAVGLITYMRTDGVQMAGEAIAAARKLIERDYGRDFLPEQPRVYTTKAKNAQEAHEAIRPTDFARRPADVARYLDDDQRRLYELIWVRALASQMESARLWRTTVDVVSEDGRIAFRANGAVVEFPGFLKLYEEGRDEKAEDDDEDRRLPKVEPEEALERRTVRPERHFTEPPPRYSEATLVKKLEELGIGRPSTYAQILSVLQDRGYVRLEKGRFIPEDSGRLVTAFLVNFFERYFAYDFTANLEEQLDEITAKRIDWKEVLRDFWHQFSRLRPDEHVTGAQMMAVKEAVETIDRALGNRTQILEAIDEALGPHFFPEREDGRDPRLCPACEQGRLGIRQGRTGAFIGCSRYPECRYTRPLSAGEGDGEGAALEGPKTLGVDPDTGLEVTLRKGPFGPYLQLGEAEGKTKPKRVSIPKDVPAEQAWDLDFALKLLRLPREVGRHPETGQTITAGLGRYGPYLEMGGKYAKLPSTQDALEIGLNRAVDVLAQPRGARGAAAPRTPAKVLGAHPQDGEPVTLHEGRYGPYVKHGKINATLPRGRKPEEVTLEQAVELLAEKAARGPSKKPARGRKASAKTAAKQRVAAE